MIITPALRQAAAIAYRMEAIFEACEIEGQDWPLYDDEVRAQAHRELGVPDDPYVPLAGMSEGNSAETLHVLDALVSVTPDAQAPDCGDIS